MKLGIDIGGTFTDLVLLDDITDEMRFAKTLTTYPDPTQGIFQGIQLLSEKFGIPLKKVHTLVHGTTLITNAIIERKGAPTALITTKGFEDILEIGREMRYDIYDLFIQLPKPLVSKDFRIGIKERMDYSGNIITPLDLGKLAKILDGLIENGIQSVAVSLLHAYANAVHEIEIGDYLKKYYPKINCSLSSEVIPEIREYERCSATVMNAYVQPLTREYLTKLHDLLNYAGFDGKLFVMDSAGRLTTLSGAIKTPIQLLESGPAGGTMACAFWGKHIKTANLLAFDMGGTTAKASIIADFKPEISHHFEAAREKRFKKGSGLPVRIPVVDMIEIGAGGGSIARVNSLGLLEVGPESATSNPGPACYDRGGLWPTVTDADLVLGYLNPDFFLGGTMPLHVEKAEKALDEKIARPLGISVTEAAWGIHRIVNENMANAARVHILEKGLDPRFFSMMAFGGAGPVHAYQVARLLGAPRLIIPAAAGVLSALGFLVSPLAREEVNSFITQFNPNDWNRINEMLLQMTEKCISFITNAQNTKAEISISRTADMRYKGQGHEIVVPIPQGTLGPDSLSTIQEHFCTEYQRRYGRNLPAVQIEAVTWRVLAQSSSPNTVPGQKKSATKRKALKGKRKVFLDNDFYEVPVYDRYSLPVGKEFMGPSIIEEFESTTVIGSLAKFQVDRNRNIIIEMQAI